MIDKEPEADVGPETLDDATVEAIRIGLESEASGNFMTLDEAVEFAKKRRGEWTKTPKAGA